MTINNILNNKKLEQRKERRVTFSTEGNKEVVLDNICVNIVDNAICQHVKKIGNGKLVNNVLLNKIFSLRRKK